MRVKHVKNGEYYLFTNFAASGNPLFLDKSDVTNFKNRLNRHLNNLCMIIGCTFKNDQFELLVLLESRKAFVEFYRKKKSDKELTVEDIPESTYIFSEEMRNVQSGYAKWFNFKYNRFGTVFGRRFTKVWIQTSEELANWVKRIRKGVSFWILSKEWSFRNCYLVRKFKIEKIDIREIFLDMLSNILRGRSGKPP